MDREIKVIQPWSMEEVAARVSQGAKGLSREVVWVKEVITLWSHGPCRIKRIRNRTRAGIERLNGCAVEIGTVEAPKEGEGGVAGQGAKPAVKNADRESTLQGSDAGEPVSVKNPASQTFEARVRKIVRVVHNEPVAGVKCRIAIVTPRIKGVSSQPVAQVFKTRSAIQGV